jgi:hypothetical protein
VTARLSKSSYVWGAAAIQAFVWIGSIALYNLREYSVEWGYSAIQLGAFLYYVRRVTQKNPQHKILHSTLMLSQSFKLGLTAYQMAIHAGMKPTILAVWTSQLFNNILFLLELTIIIVYALLARRARRDPAKWQKDTEKWLRRRK